MWYLPNNHLFLLLLYCEPFKMSVLNIITMAMYHNDYTTSLFKIFVCSPYHRILSGFLNVSELLETDL
jgi:hypothetical protein